MATKLNSRAFDLAVAHLHGMVDALHDAGRVRSR